MYPISEQLIKFNRSRKSLSPAGFVIHSTATPNATAQNEFNYFNGGDRQASVHYFADWTQIIRTIPENEQCWGCGPTGNSKYLQVEMCEPSDANQFNEVWNRTVWLVARACVDHGWSTGPNVFSHRGISAMYKETNHTDPIQFLANHGKTWEQLIYDIDIMIAVIKTPVVVVPLVVVKPVTPPSVPSVMYRIILDGVQTMAISDQTKAESIVHDAVETGTALLGIVQRNDGVNVLEYVKTIVVPVVPNKERLAINLMEQAIKTLSN